MAIATARKAAPRPTYSYNASNFKKTPRVNGPTAQPTATLDVTDDESDWQSDPCDIEVQTEELTTKTNKESKPSSTSQLYKTGDYADFTLEYQGKEYPLHRAIVCPQSKYFEIACKAQFTVRQILSLAPHQY